MKVFGLVGEKGSGKETFGNFLMEIASKKIISRVRFSDVLKETLDLWGIPPTRKNLQDLAVVMVNQYGPDALANAISKRVETLNADIVILDGLRWHEDVLLLRKFPKNLLIYITASLKNRFQRLKIRNEKTGEKNTSLKQFIKEENAKNELLIPKIGKKANFKIENDGTFNEFREKIKSLNVIFMP